MTAPLPHRNGVGPSCVALPPGSWLTVAAFLIERFPKVAPEEWAQRMQRGEVRDESGAMIDWHSRYRINARIYYYRQLADEARVPFEEQVLYQDDWIVVADKPHFLPVTPGGRYIEECLVARLKRRLGIDDLAPVHRLDRETAGLVLFSVKPETRGTYQALFRERSVEKHYEAVVSQNPALSFPLQHRSRLEDADHFMQMREVPGEANSETLMQLVETDGDKARLSLQLLTGKKHQLRVHCAALGMPILNDLIYPTLQAHGQDDHARPLQLLARSLAFKDPMTQRAHVFESMFQLMPLNSD
ncbi:MAG: pseudouridine synthase [Rhodocyclaceae bacterium]